MLNETGREAAWYDDIIFELKKCAFTMVKSHMCSVSDFTACTTTFCNLHIGDIDKELKLGLGISKQE